MPSKLVLGKLARHLNVCAASSDQRICVGLREGVAILIESLTCKLHPPSGKSLKVSRSGAERKIKSKPVQFVHSPIVRVFKPALSIGSFQISWPAIK